MSIVEDTPAVKTFYEEHSNTYIDIDNNLLILQDGNTILRTSENSGFNHIYKLTFKGISTQVTTGNWDVIEFLGIDEAKGIVYYTSAEESPLQKGIFKINLGMV